jgi:aspartokinase
LICTSSLGKGHADISLAVREANLEHVCRVLDKLKRKYHAKDLLVDRNCAMITVHGSMLSSTPGVAGKVFAQLSERKINIEMIAPNSESENTSNRVIKDV